MKNIFTWVDTHPKNLKAKLVNQSFPVVTCLTLFAFFMVASTLFITQLINPAISEKIIIHFLPVDIAIGFFLYFVTAIDYALIVGRMQVVNNGLKARFTMNVFTCLGCFVGVSFVLFLWGLAKEIDWLIIILLIFAGSVMVKLAYESLGYFRDAKSIPSTIRTLSVKLIGFLHSLTQPLTFWIPELASPKIAKMSTKKLASWAFLLPFIIGLDDFVGYMGAMTIYNVFSLLLGIYLADIVIDVLIFTSPKLTKKVVEGAILSLLASWAFLYLMYKSYSESINVINKVLLESRSEAYLVLIISVFAYIVGRVFHKKSLRSDS